MIVGRLGEREGGGKGFPRTPSLFGGPEWKFERKALPHNFHPKLEFSHNFHNGHRFPLYSPDCGRFDVFILNENMRE